MLKKIHRNHTLVQKKPNQKKTHKTKPNLNPTILLTFLAGLNVQKQGYLEYTILGCFFFYLKELLEVGVSFHYDKSQVHTHRWVKQFWTCNIFCVMQLSLYSPFNKTCILFFMFSSPFLMFPYKQK